MTSDHPGAYPGSATSTGSERPTAESARAADDGDEVTVRLPAHSIYVAVLRTAVAGVAARADFTVEDIEDLRIAVDEACTILLESAAPGAMLSCQLSGRPDTVRAAVSTTVSDPTPPDTLSFGWLVLSALAGTVQADLDGDTLTITLSRTRSA